MGQRFHINKYGVPAPCRAQKGNCPYGGDDNHFDTEEEAQIIADELNAKKYGLYSVNSDSPKVFRKAKSDEDKQFILDREDEIRSQRYPREKYINRCNTSERIDSYVPNDRTTKHIIKDRQRRTNELIDRFGEGEIIGYYKVNHKVKGEDKDQVIEIRDTGQMIIYDVYTGKTVTTFIANPQRIEITMMKAGDIPDQDWLREVDDNKFIFDTEIRKIKRRRRAS